MPIFTSTTYDAGADSCAGCKDDENVNSSKPRYTPQCLQVPSPPLSGTQVSPPVVVERRGVQSPQQSPLSRPRCNSLGVQYFPGAASSKRAQSCSDSLSHRHGSSQLHAHSMTSTPSISVLGKPFKVAQKKAVPPDPKGPILSSRLLSVTGGAVLAYKSARRDLNADTEAPVGQFFEACMLAN